MRVAFLTNTGTLYGSNRSLLDLIDGLQGFPVEPYVIVPKMAELSAALTSRGAPVATFPIQSWVANSTQSNQLPKLPMARYWRERRAALSRLKRNLALMSQLAKQLQEWKIDIVYTNSSVTPAGALAAALIRRPHIWHLREFVNSVGCGLYADWGLSLYRYLIAKSDAQIAISEAIRAFYLGEHNTGCMDVVYNGVASLAQFDQLERRAIQSRSGALSRPYTFLIMGRIEPNKGQSTAVEALAKLAATHPDVRLLIVGGGRHDTLEKLASELGVAQKIEFWGYTDDPYDAYFSADAVLVCSKSEGMGRAAAEAMSACRPVIGLNCTATPEIVEHGYTGLLFSDGAGPLADCMKQFVEDPGWARTLGINGWHVPRERYNSELHAQRIYGVLSRVY